MAEDPPDSRVPTFAGGPNQIFPVLLLSILARGPRPEIGSLRGQRNCNINSCFQTVLRVLWGDRIPLPVFTSIKHPLSYVLPSAQEITGRNKCFLYLLISCNALHDQKNIL